MNLTIYNFNGTDIAQRLEDGYMNATAMCQANGKKFYDYSRLDTTQEFLEELSSVAGIPATDLVRSMQGGDAKLQGTWVHPLVANNLGQWCSAPFAVFVSVLVYEWRKAGQPDFRQTPTQPQPPSSYSDRVHATADLLIDKGLKPDQAYPQAIKLVKDEAIEARNAVKQCDKEAAEARRIAKTARRTAKAELAHSKKAKPRIKSTAIAASQLVLEALGLEGQKAAEIAQLINRSESGVRRALVKLYRKKLVDRQWAGQGKFWYYLYRRAQAEEATH